MRDLGARSWRFYHPDVCGEQAAGFRLSNRGGIDMVQGDASVRQAMGLLLSTRCGERVMRPQFGCELDRLMFLPNDDSTAGLAIHYVRQALERWEPRIDILRLDASPHPEHAFQLDITLEYRVKTSGHEATMHLSVDLAGEDR